ncbi:acyltransferase family protein [Lichenicola sp.]|uniref:acyltransferase family protein n=1 Tax=Lichenicola sp. TaxID=2804529 RepID=UPI003B008191
MAASSRVAVAGVAVAGLPAADASMRRRERHNNFDALRLFAAIVVIYGHGLDLSGQPVPGFWNGPFARLGLDIFFCVSGYLVTQSWDRQPAAIEFALKRALRLLPGLFVCVLLTAFVLGPLMTTLPLGRYALRWQSWSYLLNMALYLQLYLPGVFTHLRGYGAVNGSLWSLLPEVLCYLTVPLLARLRPRARQVALLGGGFAAGLASIYLFHGTHPPVVEFYGLYLNYGLQEVPFFFVGAWLSLVDRGRDGFYRADIALGVFAAGYGVSTIYGWQAMPLEWVVLPYLVIGFGRMSLPVIGRISAIGDLSYGTYLYAFPVQQLLLQLFPRLPFPILACVIVTLPIAWLSWHLVERRALLLRPRLGGLVTALDRSARQADAWAMTGLRATPGLLRTPVLPLAIGVLILLVYGGQLQMGRWQTDEYRLLVNQRLWGWHILPTRLSYSPRPFSEALLFGYDWVVLHLRSPLIAPFLGALWLATLGAASWALFFALPRGRWRIVVSLVLPVMLFVFVLVTNEVTEFFFWPVAAAAYMPTALTPLLLLFLLSGPPGTTRDVACCLALLAGALSSEMGAAFAVAFAAAAAVEAVSRPVPRGPGVVRTLVARCLWWLLPGLAGLGVAVQLVRGRVHLVEYGSAARSLTGHPVASAIAASQQMLRDLVGAAGLEGGVTWLPALLLKLVFAVSLATVWRWASPGGIRLGRFAPVLACAILGSAFFSLYGAFLHYGLLCCERQSTTRFWMFDVLAVIVVLVALPRGLPGPRWLAPALLSASLAPMLWRIGGLRADYDNLHFATEARMKTWVSAAKPGDGPMQLYLPPDGVGLLIRGTSEPVGRVRIGHDAPEMVEAAGQFFRRQVVDVCQPWQSEQSWLYYGRFIPACPPHGGPPDRIYPTPDPTRH